MKASARALRTAPEAAERLLLAAAVSAVAADVDREEVLAWLQQEGLWAKASPMERAFLSAAQPSEKSKVHFSWQMESVYVLGWALNLLPAMTPPTTQASIGDILERVPGPGDRVGDFVASSKLRAAAEILEDPRVALVLGAGINAERAPLGVEVMRHGKDFFVDKPGVTELAQLEEVRRVQAETKRLYVVCFSERFESRATQKAASP